MDFFSIGLLSSAISQCHISSVSTRSLTEPDPYRSDATDVTLVSEDTNGDEENEVIM